MKKQNIFQAIVILIVIAAAAFVAIDQTLPPNALPPETPDTEFSAERAIEHIKIIAQEPRLPDSVGFDNARDYVLSELRALGLTPEIQRATVSVPAELLATLGRSPDLPDLPPEEVENITARIEGTKTQDAILLVVHLDSRDGPGATDNGSGVAVLLETARALQSVPPLQNTVILLFTDREETGLYGAKAFITEHPWIDDVKLVFNFDAGGLSGPSALTNSSPDNGWLIREAAKADPYFFASSAFGEGSSDFNAFKYYGFSGYAFDYSWDRRIHSQNDNIENLNPPSIQHQGFHALSLARYFGDLESLDDPKEPNPIYFNILRSGFIQYPVSWAIPISLIIVLVFTGVVVLGFKRQLLTLSGIGLGALVLVISLVSAPLLVNIVWKLLSMIVPTYQSTYLGHTINESLLAILFASITTALTLTWFTLVHKIREISAPDLTIGAFALLTLSIVGFAIAMPEGSHLSAWPGFFAFLTAGYWFFSTKDGSETFLVGQIVALLLAAIISIVLMLPTYISSFMSSEANDWTLSIVIMVLMLGTLVPQLQIITRPKKWWLPITAWAAAAMSFVAAILG